MNGMFAYADHITSLPIGLPNTTSVTDMVSLFSNALLFDQDISSWCVISIGTKPADFDTNTPTPTFRNNV
jgi:surface protein